MKPTDEKGPQLTPISAPTAWTCPDCGAELKRKTAKHAESLPCTAARRRRALEARGYCLLYSNTLNYETRRALCDLEITEYHPTHAGRGGWGRPSKITDDAWIPKWAMDIARSFDETRQAQLIATLRLAAAAGRNNREEN